MGRSVLRGRPAVVEGWKAFFEGPKAPFSWQPDRVEVVHSGTLAFSTGPVFDPEGKRDRHLQLHLAPRDGRRVAGRARQRMPALQLPVREPSMTDHVRVCRECGEEYRPEVVRCADCGGELEDRFEGEEEGRRPPGPGARQPRPSSPGIACSS